MPKATVTLATIMRVVKAVQAAGLPVVRLEIDQAGKLAVITSVEPEGNADSALAEWKRTNGTD